MFQLFAVTYTLEGHEDGFATTVTVDLEEAYQTGMAEMGDARRLLARKAIACRRWGRPEDQSKVELTEIVRLGDPTETP